MNHRNNLKASPENWSTSLNLNLDEPSKVIITKARIEIAIRKVGENSNIGFPSKTSALNKMPANINSNTLDIFSLFASNVISRPASSTIAMLVRILNASATFSP